MRKKRETNVTALKTAAWFRLLAGGAVGQIQEYCYSVSTSCLRERAVAGRLAAG